MARQLYKKKGGKSTGGKEVQQEEVEQQPQPTEQQEEAPSQVEESAQLQQAVSVEAVDEVLPKRPVALAELPLHVIIPSRAQAREEESLTPASLEGLVASMQEHGILSRIRVRQIASESDEEERFELVFGERRWRAARLAGFTHYPVEIAQYTDDELEEVGLVENLQRQDLTPLEEARKFERLLTLQDESGQPKYSIRKLATRIGKDKSYIEMRLAVLRGEDLQELARIQPDVPLRIVYEISKVEDKEKREDLITEVREGGLKKVEEVKTRVREATGRTKNVLAPSS
ncbi:MAG TPA: ParB/RepB/Spo0J family partition protein, partial [Ktedonobacteraceae bacterium]|nr:ParB/RepB/Spo0J family partition protein [Ktedonobacteraceae bacterium]